jgi:hypothetical protein
MKLWTPSRDIYRKPTVGQARINWAHPIARGLVGCWVFNETAGKSPVNIANNTVGTWLGDPTWTIRGINFTNANSGIQLSSQITLINGDKWSLMFRAKHNTSADYGAAIGYADWADAVVVFPEQYVRLYNSSASVYWTESDTYTTFKSFAVTHDGTNATYYKDGVMHVSGAQAIGANFRFKYLGMGWSDTNSPFKGDIEYLYFWKGRTLSLSEIQQIAAFPYCFLRPVQSRAYKAAAGAPETITMDKWYCDPSFPRRTKTEVVSY